MAKSMIDTPFEGEEEGRVTFGDDGTTERMPAANFIEVDIGSKPEGKEKAEDKTDQLDVIIKGDDDIGSAEEKPVGDDLPTDEEIKSYSKNVQKRISQLTERFHSERRQREDLDRRYQDTSKLNDESIAHMRRLIAENNQLKELIENGEKVLIGEHKGRLEADLAQAKAAYREAHEAGDTAGIIAANEKLARLAAQIERVGDRRFQPLQKQDEEEFIKTLRPQQQQPQQPKPTDKALEWYKRNDWWARPGSEAMTNFALGLHQQLIQHEGVRPDTDEYFSRIDEEVRKRFPERFNSAPRRTASNVAPVSRQSGQDRQRKTVQLSESQVRLARRLGLTPQQYAEQVALEQDANGKD